MASETPNLDIRVGYPGGTALVDDYVRAGEEVRRFYRGHFRRLADYRERAAAVDARFDRGSRARALEALVGPPGGDGGRGERFVEEGGYVVTTGQQPGLFGGPLYTIYKALTAVRLAEALEAALGKPVLPVFWVASEDHDWAEANHTHVVGVDNELHRVEVADPDPSIQPPLHRVPLADDVRGALAAFLDALPRTEFSGPFVEMLRETSVPGETLPGSFHRVLGSLLGPRGVYFTDAAHPVVKAASLDLLFRELDRSEEFEAVLGATGRELEEAGYDLQVTLLEGGVNLFLEGPSGRERLYRDDGGVRLHTSGVRMELDEVRERARADPSTLSPNVLLRPVVESHVFPTLSYVGGPGEVAYFAQLAGYFEAFGMPMPVVHPRFGAVAVEAKVAKVLDKFGLQADALRRPHHELASDIVRDEIPAPVRRALGRLRGAVASGVSELEEEARGIDPTLSGPVGHVKSQAFQALDDAEKKIVHALKREKETALAQLDKARLHLYPEGKPQERVMNPFYYLVRYGPAFLDALHQRFRIEVG